MKSHRRKIAEFQKIGIRVYKHLYLLAGRTGQTPNFEGMVRSCTGACFKRRASGSIGQHEDSVIIIPVSILQFKKGNKIVLAPFVVLAMLAILWMYQWAADRGMISTLFVHIFFVTLVLLFRKHIFNFEKLDVSISRKEIVWMIVVWFILLSINIVVSLERSVTYISDDDPLRRLWWNMPLIMAFLIPIAWKWAFLWYGCKKLSLEWRNIGLSVTSISTIGFWTVIVSSFLLIRLFWYGNWPTDILWNPKVVLSFSFDLMGNISGAVLEEMLFRGLFFTMLRSRINIISAWIWQATLFGLSHMFVSDPIGAVGPGLLFGLGVLGSGSLYPGIFAHLLMNILGTLDAASNVAS